MFENTNMAKIRGGWGFNYEMIKDYFEKDEVVGWWQKGTRVNESEQGLFERMFEGKIRYFLG
jgi:hypothetical protein